MRNRLLLIVVLLILVGIILLYKDETNQNKVTLTNNLGLRHIVDIPLTGGANRLDYQNIDINTNTLYVSHLDSSMVHVFDLREQKVIKNIHLTSSPYGILAVPSLKEVFVSIGGNNQVAIIDEKTLKVTKYIQAGETPDGISYDPSTNKIFVSNENGGTVTVIDVKKNERIEDIKVGGAVGNTQYDSISKLIYSAIGEGNALVEIDPKSNIVLNKYDLKGCEHPHGFYIDEQTHYALITCDVNNKLVVFDLNTKQIIYSNTVGGTPDVLAFDQGLHRLYVAAESGTLAIFSVEKKNIKKLGQAFLADKAHTVSVNQQTHLLYFPLENINGKPILRIMKPQSM